MQELNEENDAFCKDNNAFRKDNNVLHQMITEKEDLYQQEKKQFNIQIEQLNYEKKKLNHRLYATNLNHFNDDELNELAALYLTSYRKIVCYQERRKLGLESYEPASIKQEEEEEDKRMKSKHIKHDLNSSVSSHDILVVSKNIDKKNKIDDDHIPLYAEKQSYDQLSTSILSDHEIDDFINMESKQVLTASNSINIKKESISKASKVHVKQHHEWYIKWYININNKKKKKKKKQKHSHNQKQKNSHMQKKHIIHHLKRYNQLMMIYYLKKEQENIQPNVMDTSILFTDDKIQAANRIIIPDRVSKDGSDSLKALKEIQLSIHKSHRKKSSSSNIIFKPPPLSFHTTNDSSQIIQKEHNHQQQYNQYKKKQEQKKTNPILSKSTSSKDQDAFESLFQLQ